MDYTDYIHRSDDVEARRRAGGVHEKRRERRRGVERADLVHDVGHRAGGQLLQRAPREGRLKLDAYLLDADDEVPADDSRRRRDSPTGRRDSPAASSQRLHGVAATRAALIHAGPRVMNNVDEATYCTLSLRSIRPTGTRTKNIRSILDVWRV